MVTRMRAATHDGSFHADDVFCWTLLSRLFPDAVLDRTRDENRIESADLVFDVGMVFDPSNRRFDHCATTARPTAPSG